LVGIIHSPQYTVSLLNVFKIQRELLSGGLRKFICGRNVLLLFKGVSILIININIIRLYQTVM